VSFYESRRSGNIAVAVTPTGLCGCAENEIAGRIQQSASYRPSSGEEISRESGTLPSRSPADKDGDSGRHAGAAAQVPLPNPRPHSGRSIEAQPRDQVRQSFGAPELALADHVLIASLMDHDRQNSEGGSPSASPRPTLHRARIDSRLARIIDAWPGLPPTVREAMAAVLDGATSAAPSQGNADDAAAPPERPHSPAAKNRTASRAAEPRTHRTRKTANPSQERS
jgi:hypothetical protein